MKKKICIAALVLGFALIAAAFVIPWMMLLSSSAVELGIIGGANWPTAMFLFRQLTQGFLWIGVLFVIGGAAGLLIRKK